MTEENIEQYLTNEIKSLILGIKGNSILLESLENGPSELGLQLGLTCYADLVSANTLLGLYKKFYSNEKILELQDLLGSILEKTKAALSEYF